MSKSALPAAVLFDMDGVLVDSEYYIAEAGRLMFAEKGLKVSRADFKPFAGTGDNRYIGGVAEKYNFAIDIQQAKSRTYDIYLEIIKGKLKTLAGVIDFIEKCRSMNKKIAVASSADFRKVQGNLEEINLPVESFDAIVTGEDIEHKKPAPDIFLLAAKKLNVNPAHCLVIEDAPSGVAAAKAAGSRCLAITSSFTPQQLTGADYFAANLVCVDSCVLSW